MNRILLNIQSQSKLSLTILQKMQTNDTTAGKIYAHFHNNFHLGDCLLVLRFMFAIKEHLQENNICIIFHYKQCYMGQYLKELEVYSVPATIELTSHPYPAISYDTWMGHSVNGQSHENWVVYFEMYYKKIVHCLGLNPERIACRVWQPEPYLHAICDGLPDPCKHVDILVINGTAHSGQYNRDRSEMDALCRFLDASYTIISTRKVDNISCTLDYDLRVRDIGAIATRARFVIAIFTGPMCALYSEEAKAFVTKWFIIASNNIHYNHTGIDYTMITNGDLAPIYTYFGQPR